jgi:four helix bundle protein
MLRVASLARSLDTASARSGWDPMLTIYPVILQTISDLKPQLERIERHDRDLGRQMRRAASSVALNVAEGQYSRGRNRAARYHNALGSARETMACLEVAVALGYLDRADAEVMDRLGRIVGTLVRLVQRQA